MSGSLDGRVAAVKVIPAGCTADGRLRATVMLTPNGEIADPAELARWPSQVLDWLKGQQQPWKVQLYAFPITYSDDNTCRAPATDLTQLKAVEADATGMRLAWSSSSSLAWVEELWRETFTVNGETDWKRLAELITAGTKKDNVKKGNAGTAPTVNTNSERKTSPDEKKPEVSVESILPSRQTDLAFLFECKRALELCDTVHHAAAENAHDKPVDREIKCMQEAKKKGLEDGHGSAPLDLGMFYTASQERFTVVGDRLKDNYGKMLCGGTLPALPVPAATDPTSASNRDRLAIEQSLHQRLDLYQAANVPQDDGSMVTEDVNHERACAPARTVDPAVHLSHRYFNVQGSPALSRLFGLVFDVYFEQGELLAALKANGGIDWAADGTQFVYLSLQRGSICQAGMSCVVHTLVKYRPEGTQPHFWPVSRAEIVLGPKVNTLEHLKLNQFDGITVMGQQMEVDGEKAVVPRFDISSLDVRTAAEAALDRRVNQASEADVQKEYKDSSLAARPSALARKTHRSAGIVILDRGRQEQTIAQFAARGVHQARLLRDDAYLILDADDLAIGYRVDVAVPLQGCDKHEWRPLMARDVEHGTSGRHAARVSSVLPLLFQDSAKSSSEWRKRLDDGVISLPARLIPRATAQPDSKAEVETPESVDAYIEESIATWDGESMSVPCAGNRKDKVQQGTGMAVGSVIRLPTARAESKRRACALRFGWPYRFGIRVTYPGGISLGLHEAEDRYARILDSGRPDGRSLTLPATIDVAGLNDGAPAGRAQFRRFLRQERIDAPFLLLDEDIALRSHGEMGYERAAHAIVRSTTKEMHNRGRPTLTRRVFVLPAVNSSFAALHGVLDCMNEKQPPQGLRPPLFGANGVRFDAKKGGFPIVTADSITGINGVRYDKQRRISLDNETDTGDLVYSTRLGGKRPSPYYPDPGASHFAIGLRYAGSDTYLSGSCPIPVYANGRSFPHARPLVLNIQRTAKRRYPWPSLDQVLTVGNASIGGWSRIPGSVEATVSLAPGEDFEVDVWCIPSVKQLAQWFAVIEAIGTLAVHSDPSPKGMLESLSKILPRSVCEIVGKCIADTKPADCLGGYAGLGGLPGPGKETLLAIATAIHEQLSKRPLDEISAVRTLRVTHAIDKPQVAPAFALPKESTLIDKYPPREVTLQRVSPSTAGCQYRAEGDVVFDVRTAGSLELRAFAVCPSSIAMDDVRRGRSLRDRANRTWPQRPRLRKGQLPEEVPLTTDEVFGFCVRDDGEVTLQRSEVVLQQLAHIPLAPQPTQPKDEKSRTPLPLEADKDGRCVLQLESFFGLREPEQNVGQSKLPFQFTDQLARRILLQVRAYPRHAEQMSTASPAARDGIWLRDGRALDPERSHVAVQTEVWLPAGVRPAEPNASTPMPAFVWRREQDLTKTGRSFTKLKRRSIIRIPLARPWFSSGEGERLGIVVWPPNLQNQDRLLFENDIVQLPATFEPCKEPGLGRRVDLSEFTDEDLGAGGRFVTRWGGDPIRPAATLHELVYDDREFISGIVSEPRNYKRTFVPESAFVDLHADTRLGFEATWVENVLMPVRSPDKGKDSKAAGDGGAASPQRLNVSLITYVPRFDVNTEEWYAEVGMHHPFEAEPFVRLGLVRYQPQAPCELQVSYPVIQWTQLLPNRDVEVRASTGHRTKQIDVRIEGLAMTANAARQDPDVERNSVHKMDTVVIREHTLASGAIARREIPTVQPRNEELPHGEMRGAFHMVWKRAFTIDVNEQLDADEKASYWVFINEREARLPATYATEPVSAAEAIGRDCEGRLRDDLQIESGPRFLARIRI